MAPARTGHRGTATALRTEHVQQPDLDVVCHGVDIDRGRRRHGAAVEQAAVGGHQAGTPYGGARKGKTPRFYVAGMQALGVGNGDGNEPLDVERLGRLHRSGMAATSAVAAAPASIWRRVRAVISQPSL